jgi:hypothetical protein
MTSKASSTATSTPMEESVVVFMDTVMVKVSPTLTSLADKLPETFLPEANVTLDSIKMAVMHNSSANIFVQYLIVVLLNISDKFVGASSS